MITFYLDSCLKFQTIQWLLVKKNKNKNFFGGVDFPCFRRTDALVCLVFHNRIPSTGQLITTYIYFSQFWKLESPRSKGCLIWCLARASWFKAVSSLCVLMARGTREFPGVPSFSFFFLFPSPFIPHTLFHLHSPHVFSLPHSSCP